MRNTHKLIGANVRRKIMASFILLSILILAIPFTPVTQVGLARPAIAPQGGLSPQDIDAINALADELAALKPNK